jgi:hypothetical protein
MSHDDDDWDSSLAEGLLEVLGDVPLPLAVVLGLVAAIIALLLYHYWG